MFPGAGASVYRNEDGEVLGWDYPATDDPYDPDDWYDQTGWEADEFFYAAEVWDTCQCGDDDFGACGKDTCVEEYEVSDGDMKTEAQWDAVRYPV